MKAERQSKAFIENEQSWTFKFGTFECPKQYIIKVQVISKRNEIINMLAISFSLLFKKFHIKKYFGVFKISIFGILKKF